MYEFNSTLCQGWQDSTCRTQTGVQLGILSVIAIYQELCKPVCRDLVPHTKM
jgi:hypothetical protein